MFKNYQAWSIDPKNFPSNQDKHLQFEFLVGYALLAPSSHNSQPWCFYVTDDGIIISPNVNRTLPLADPDKRLLYISMGCALENLLVAADYFKFEARVINFFDKDSKLVKIKITLIPKDTIQLSDRLFFSISRRHTNRSKYTSKALPRDFIKKIDLLSTENVTINLITDQTQKEEIANQLLQSRMRAFEDQYFRKELSDYKRTNYTRSGLGIPGFTMGFRTPFSLIAPWLIRYVNIMKFIGKGEKNLLTEYTPAYIIIATKKNDIDSWIEAGRFFERIALEAEQLDIRTAISALPPDVSDIQKILNIKNRPQVFLRIGYSSISKKHSPRLPLADLIN